MLCGNKFSRERRCDVKKLPLIFGTTARLDWSQFRTWRGVVEACAGVTLVEHSSAVLCPEVRYVYTSYYAVHSPGEVFTEVHERFTKLQRHYPVLCPEVRACREVRTCDAWGMLLEPVLTHDGNRRVGVVVKPCRLVYWGAPVMKLSMCFNLGSRIIP